MNGKIKGMLQAAPLIRKAPAPDPSIWLFSSTDNRHFNYNSRALFLYVLEHCPDINALYVMDDDKARARLSAQYGAGHFIETRSKEGMEKALSAGVWFTSAGLPVYGTHLDEGRLVINLWHGIPLKRIVLQDPSYSRLSRLYFKKVFSDNYTDVVTTSSAVSKVMQESFAVPEKKMRIWGEPRCDLLFQNFDISAYFRVQYPELIDVKKRVLYAPTFRTGRPVRLFPFPDFDRDALEDFLEEKKILLCIRLHLAEADQNPMPESKWVRYLNEDRADDVMSVLQGFDLLVTDYSSIYLDYLLLDRPIIFLPYDLAEYEKEHGFTFPYEEVTPGKKPATQKQFLEALESGLEQDEERESRQRIKRMFHENQYPCSGDICKRVRERIKK